MTMPARVVTLDRADAGKFLPVTTTIVSSGDPVDDADVQFALVARNTRPGDDDWFPAVDNPDQQAGGIGLYLQAVADAQVDGVWVKVTVGEAVEIIPPTLVGWVQRS